MKPSCALLAAALVVAASIASVSCGSHAGSNATSNALCSNLRDAISFLAFVPCRSGPPGECDVFAYPAALLAAEHINSHPSILKFPELGFNTSLKLVERETMGDTALASFSLTEYIRSNRPETIQGIIGPSTSAATETIAYITGRNFNLLEISYGATDPSLSDRDIYTLLFSTIRSEEFLNLGRLTLLNKFKWFRCGVIASRERIYARAAEHFGSLSRRYPHLDIAYYGSFVLNPDFAFEEIFTSDLRIILGLFGERNARSVICQASNFRDGRLTDSNHVWILPSYYNPDWWKLNESEIEELPLNQRCSNEKMESLLTSNIFIDSFRYHPAESTTSGLTLEDFYEQLLNKSCQLFPHDSGRETLAPYLPHSTAPTAYDAVWSLALAWNEAIPELLNKTSICEMDNSTQIQSLASEVLERSMMNVVLSGISGQHNFNFSQDADGQILISQFFNGDHWSVGTYEVIQENEGIDSLELSEFKFLNASDARNVYLNPSGSFMWRGPNNEPPSDGVEVVLSSISIAFLSLAVILLLVALAVGAVLLIINIAMRNNKYIKASSPKLNLITISGLMLVMPSSILLGLSYSRYEYGIPQIVANVICQLDIWLTAVGFVLAFASMFAKQWRLWRIFQNSDMQKRRNISDNQLLLLSFALVLPVVIVLTAWLAVDPLTSQDTVIAEGNNVELNITVCTSQLYRAWRGAYIAYTVLLILGLMFIGIQNQNITSRFKNSKVAARFTEEGNSTGRVTLLSVFIFVVFFLVLLFLQTDIKLYVPTFWMNICWSLLLPVMLLLAIYIPKFFDIHKGSKERKRLLQQHQRFAMIRKQMTTDDLLRRQQQKQKQQPGIRSGLMQCNPMFAVAELHPAEVVANQHAATQEEESSSSVPRVEIEDEKTSIFELDDTIVDLEANSVRFYFVPK